MQRMAERAVSVQCGVHILETQYMYIIVSRASLTSKESDFPRRVTLLGSEAGPYINETLKRIE